MSVSSWKLKHQMNRSREAVGWLGSQRSAAPSEARVRLDRYGNSLRMTALVLGAPVGRPQPPVTLRDIKANSAKWVNEEHLSTEKFEWQKGYGAFTVSYSNIDTVQVYIRNQHEHHRSRSFRDEYIEFLKRHGIEIEEQFLFEGEHTG